jgi:hypothetical protein
MKRKVILAGAVLLGLGLLYIGTTIVRERTLSFDNWVSRVSRPNYQLLDSQRTESHFVAVFRVDEDALAVFSRRRAGPESRGRTLDVRSLDGESLVQGTAGHVLRRGYRVNELILDLFGPYSKVEGDLWRIKPDYRGRMRVSFGERSLGGERFRYDRVVDWKS